MHRFSRILVALFFLLNSLVSVAADRSCCESLDCQLMQCANMGCAATPQLAVIDQTQLSPFIPVRPQWISMELGELVCAIEEIWTPPD
jgi:hypothetical protein